MKLISFFSEGHPSYGVAKDSGVVDLGARLGDRWATLRALLAAGALAEAQRVARDAAPDLQLEGLELAPVIPDPDKIVCVGVSGTCGGVGWKRDPPLFMRPGDVAEVEISGIGVLRNPVVAEAA